MVSTDLTTGEHTADFKEASGYKDLSARILVSDTEVSCVSVDGSTDGCTRTTTPYIAIPSAFSVSAILQQLVTIICSWIDESDVNNLKIDHALYVYYLSAGWSSLAETKYNTLSPKPSRLDTSLATLANALGIYYYSQKWKSLGNTKTGCAYT